MDEIKKIYLGLPQDMRTRVFWVGRKFRTNLLSHQPGGGDIIVEYHSGKIFGYDWIKYPSRYVLNIFNRHFKKNNENFETFKENIQLGIIKKCPRSKGKVEVSASLFMYQFVPSSSPLPWKLKNKPKAKSDFQS